MDLSPLKIDRARSAPRRGRGIGRWIALALVGLAVWIFWAPLQRLVDRLRLPEVEVVRAVRTSPLAASAVTGTAANGYIVAKNRAALSADTPGRIVEMNVEEGSVVKAGDVVARLYSDEYRAALESAEARFAAAKVSVRRSEADLERARSELASRRASAVTARARGVEAQARVTLAEKNLARALELLKSNFGSQQAVDEATSEKDQAQAALEAEQSALTSAESAITAGEAELAAAEAAVDESVARGDVERANRDLAQATLDKTEVRAPFDGVVVLKDAEVGEVVSPNSQGGNSRGSVVTMVDFASLEAQVDMPETNLSAVRIGGAATIYLDAFPTHAYKGAVKRIWPTANRQKATVEVRIGFEAPDERLRPEMGVRVVFAPEGAAPAASGPKGELVMIPANCVVRIASRAGVFELERDRALWREVELGDEQGERVVVLAGLNGGERVVVAPPAGLNDGDRVLPKEAP